MLNQHTSIGRFSITVYYLQPNMKLLANMTQYSVKKLTLSNAFVCKRTPIRATENLKSASQG
jgi:hypothetical protein